MSLLYSVKITVDHCGFIGGRLLLHIEHYLQKSESNNAWLELAPIPITTMHFYEEKYHL